MVNVKDESKRAVVYWEALRLHVPSCAAPDAIAANQRVPPGPPPVAHPFYEEGNNVLSAFLRIMMVK